jgi:hypothetical protein
MSSCAISPFHMCCGAEAISSSLCPVTPVYRTFQYKITFEVLVASKTSLSYEITVFAALLRAYKHHAVSLPIQTYI